jgi:hypothetical protein
MLYTTDMKPAGYNTKWEELHAESQKALLQIEYGSSLSVSFFFTCPVL